MKTAAIPARNLLLESLSVTEAQTYRQWHRVGRVITEAQLTPQQIQQVFQQAAADTAQGGDNRTALGKTVDAGRAVKQAFDSLATKVQNTAPVKGFDALYDRAAQALKQKTGGDQGVMKYIQAYRDFAKKHPIAQGLIYSALIAAAGITGAGAGGAAALGLFKMADRLLQGDKFSSALAKGAATGALAYGASKVGDYIRSQFGGQPPGPTGQGVSGDVNAALAADEQLMQRITAKYPPESGFTYRAEGQNLKVFNAQGQPVFMGAIQPKTMPMSTFADLANAGKTVQPQTFVGTGAQNASIKESRRYVDRDATVRAWLLNEMTGRARGGVHLTEQGVMAAIKGAASKAADYVGTKAQNLTNKVTADKLMAAWKRAGSPTDSEDIKQILHSAGVPQQLAVSSVDAVIRAPAAATPQPTAQTAQSAQPAAQAVTALPADQQAFIDKIAGFYFALPDAEKPAVTAALDQAITQAEAEYDPQANPTGTADKRKAINEAEVMAAQAISAWISRNTSAEGLAQLQALKAAIAAGPKAADAQATAGGTDQAGTGEPGADQAAADGGKQTVGSYLKQYVMNTLKNYKIDPQVTAQLDKLAQQFEKAYNPNKPKGSEAVFNRVEELVRATVASSSKRERGWGQTDDNATATASQSQAKNAQPEQQTYYKSVFDKTITNPRQVPSALDALVARFKQEGMTDADLAREVQAAIARSNQAAQATPQPGATKAA